jgi:hypothetical protein
MTSARWGLAALLAFGPRVGALTAAQHSAAAKRRGMGARARREEPA